MTVELKPQLTTAYWNDRSKGRLPGMLGVTLLEIEAGRAVGEIALRPELWAPNGFLHAATVVGLADTLCGYACVASLPEGASGFTTVETKSNHLGTATEGTISCAANMAHGGRTTQVWDATITHNETGKTIALFRCTQMVLWPR